MRILNLGTPSTPGPIHIELTPEELLSIRVDLEYMEEEANVPLPEDLRLLLHKMIIAIIQMDWHAKEDS